MLKIMAIMSLLLQTFISIVGNERGEVLTAEQIAANKLVEDTKIKEAAELKATSRKEVLRDLSKELGINAFEPSEIKAKFEEHAKWKSEQQTDTEKLQVEIDAYKLKETTWLTKETEFNSKLKASELGIPTDKLEDALKLAGGDPSKLEDVIKKYPSFKSKEGVVIGIQNTNNNNNLDGLTEMETYMAKNPSLYGKYTQK